MPTQSLRPMLEALAPQGGLKHIAGSIADPAQLLEQGALQRFDDAYPDALFGLVLHDPAADAGVAAYLRTGSVAMDSGSGIVVLYEPAPRARPLDAVNGIALSGENPVVAFARGLFPGKPPVLPGLVVLRRLATATDAVYIPLGGNQEAVTALAREVFKTMATVVHDVPDQPFAERLGLALGRAGIDYRRSEPMAIGEHVTRFVFGLWQRRRDLMGFVPIVGKLLANKS